MRIALVSCVKSKRAVPAPARDLYESPLFRGLRGYAEKHADTWFILSAQHGLVDPARILEPYERTLNRLGKAERLRWAARVQRQLLEVLPPGTEIVVLAGVRYRENLVPFLRDRGFSLTIPLEGLSFGKQLQHLKSLGLI